MGQKQGKKEENTQLEEKEAVRGEVEKEKRKDNSEEIIKVDGKEGKVEEKRQKSLFYFKS